MRKHIKSFLLLAATYMLAAPVATAQNGTSYTVRDLESWTSAKLKYQFSKKLDFGIEEQLRLKDNARTVDQYFTEITAGYDITKHIGIGLGGRYIKQNDNVGKIQGYENHFRWNADLAYKHKIERFDLKYRIRYQNKDELQISEAQGDTAKHTVRLKVSADYDIKNWKLDPEVAAELFNRLNNSEGLYRIRFTVGTTYEFKKAGELGAFYRIEKALQGNSPKTTNIIGVQYQYTLKRK
jgi:hypothetical protein